MDPRSSQQEDFSTLIAQCWPAPCTQCGARYYSVLCLLLLNAFLFGFILPRDYKSLFCLKTWQAHRIGVTSKFCWGASSWTVNLKSTLAITISADHVSIFFLFLLLSLVWVQQTEVLRTPSLTSWSPDHRRYIACLNHYAIRHIASHYADDLFDLYVVAKFDH